MVDMLSGFRYSVSKTTTWLTADEKDALMKELESADQEGALDDGSFRPLRRLNSLPGLASAFSCMGHQERPNYGGYLALRVSHKIAIILDKCVVDKLWEDGLIYYATKQWQYASDTADQPIPRVIYTLRFPVGFMERVCEAIYQYINKEL